MTARTSRTKRALFAGILFLLVIGFLESALALLALASQCVEQLLASPWTETRPAIPDRRLGHRPTPGYPGHDGKEAVFRELWQNPPSSYRSPAENEERMWRRTKEFLERHGIEHLDALPALRAQLSKGTQPYPVSIDGHPNEQGRRAIAGLLAARLRSP